MKPPPWMPEIEPTLQVKNAVWAAMRNHPFSAKMLGTIMVLEAVISRECKGDEARSLAMLESYYQWMVKMMPKQCELYRSDPD